MKNVDPASALASANSNVIVRSWLLTANRGRPTPNNQGAVMVGVVVAVVVDGNVVVV